jgi:hypothetical protein
MPSKNISNRESPKTKARVHDIFLRAYAIPAEQKKKQKSTRSTTKPAEKWPEFALVFDTETRITPDQSLTFGVYHFCRLVKAKYEALEDGIFYSDNLPKKESDVLKTYQRTGIPDTTSFPPQFPFYSRSEFMRRVFWPAIRRGNTLICGLNLPFDLSRLAVNWNKGENDEWSLTMSPYADGRDNKNYPHILIQPIDSKKAFIKVAKPWKPKKWKNKGQVPFLDLRTLAWALFNESFSLKRLCEELKAKHQKIEHEPTGKITLEEIEYARGDVRCTVDALNALKNEFDKHPIDLLPNNAYSPASVAKSYLDAMGIIKPREKFDIPEQITGIAMQSYYGGRSETRIRNSEVPVMPVDFTSEYPTSCALLGLFEALTAEQISFGDDTENIRTFLNQISLENCFNPSTWKELNFFALVQPNDDIFPVRTVYDGLTQNIGNNYLSSDTPIWFAGPDLIASTLLSKQMPQIIHAVRMVPHGKQPGMKTVNLRGSMVEIDPYKDDIFRKVIEQRRLNKSDKALAYWLKIFANSIYGFFVELIPDIQKKKVPVEVFSGEKTFPDSSDVIENTGQWFFPPLAALITSAGRLLLAMIEASVNAKRGTYLFCDTDSLAIVSSKSGGPLDIAGSEGKRALSWKEVDEITEQFGSLNPYDRKIVKRSILNLVDANYVDSNPDNPQRQLYGYSIAAKRYALYERIGDSDIRIVDPKAHGIGFLYPPKNSPKGWEEKVPLWIYEMWDFMLRGALKLEQVTPSWLDIPQMMRLTVTTHNVLKMLGEWKIARPYNFLLLPIIDPVFGYAFHRRSSEKVLLVCPFSSDQQRWFDLECINVYDGKQYRMVDSAKETNPPHNVVFPSKMRRRVIEYQEHPEAKSLAPDDSPCGPETRGVLKRAHIIAGEFRYIGKETDRKWEEGDDLSILEFKTTEYGRSKKVVAREEIKNKILETGINKCARESGFDRKNFIRKLVRGVPVKRNSYQEFVRWLQSL